MTGSFEPTHTARLIGVPVAVVVKCDGESVTSISLPSGLIPVAAADDAGLRAESAASSIESVLSTATASDDMAGEGGTETGTAGTAVTAVTGIGGVAVSDIAGWRGASADAKSGVLSTLIGVARASSSSFARTGADTTNTYQVSE